MYDSHSQRSHSAPQVQSAILTQCILAGLMPSTRTPSAAAQEAIDFNATATPTAVAFAYSSYLGRASSDGHPGGENPGSRCKAMLPAMIR